MGVHALALLASSLWLAAACGGSSHDVSVPGAGDASVDGGASDSAGDAGNPGDPADAPDGATPTPDAPDSGEPPAPSTAMLPDLPTPPADRLEPAAQREQFGLTSDPPHPIFDHAEVRHYHVVVDPDEWAHINETAYLEEYIQGTLWFEGVPVEPVGLRFKGFRGSLYNCFQYDADGNVLGRTCERLSLKLSFNEYDPEGRFYGLKKLNFHSMNNDRSQLRERLAYWLFRQFGVPAPRAVHAILSVNDENLGLYSLVEQVDGRFARHRFADGGQGNLYKERWPTSSTDPEYFFSGLKTNEMDPGVSVQKMVDFAAAVQAADASSIEAVLAEYTDLDALMRYLAVDRAIDHWDGITAFRCRLEEDVPPLPPEIYAAQTPPLGWEVCQNKNFYFYEETSGPRLWLTAWDTDVSFPAFPQPFPAWDAEPTECNIQQQGRPPGCDPLIRYFATALRPRYVAAGNAFLETLFRQDVIEPRLREWSAQIAPHVGAGPDDRANTVLDDVMGRISAFTAEMAR